MENWHDMERNGILLALAFLKVTKLSRLNTSASLMSISWWLEEEEEEEGDNDDDDKKDRKWEISNQSS